MEELQCQSIEVKGKSFREVEMDLLCKTWETII